MNTKWIEGFKSLPYEKQEELFQNLSNKFEKATDDNDGAKINRIEKTLTRVLATSWNDTSTKAITRALKTFPHSTKRFSKKDADKVLASLTKSFKGVEKKTKSRVENDLEEIYRINKVRFGKEFSLSSTDTGKKELTFNYFDYIPETEVEKIGGEKFKVGGYVAKENKIIKEWNGKFDLLKAVEFGALDKAAYDNLARLENISIGDHFPKTMKPKVSRSLETALERGLNQADASQFLEQELTQSLGGSSAGALPASVAQGKAATAAYYEMLNATNITYARNFGQINLMAEVGIETLVFNAILDRVTSVVCNQMNGRTFTIQQAMQHQQSVLGAANVEALKGIAPFTRNLKEFGLKEGQKLTSAKASASLAAAGVIIPPLHGRCRSELQPA